MRASTHLHQFIKDIVDLCCPDNVHVCSGSDDEYDQMCKIMEHNGTAIRLNQLKRQNCLYVRTDPSDVARVEEVTYICSQNKDDAGPTNNWRDPIEMREKILSLFSRSMHGRTMYVIPYVMGPIGSPMSKCGIEITDSPYVVANMKIMSRMGREALSLIEKGEEFVAGVHSVGMPINNVNEEVPWPCNKEKLIAHFPESRQIWSFGSGYGGNALLGKKCFALRIASAIGRDDGWLAEHMLIMGVTNPNGVTKYFVAAFPSACGKTNLAMMLSTLPGWSISCIGDDIAWMYFGDDGRLYAINPENGFFGVAPGTSVENNPNAMKCIEKNTIFTNVALTEDFDVWWEGMTKVPPQGLRDWKGNAWDSNSKSTAAHPNSRFTTPIRQCPSFDKMGDDLRGVPIDGIIFGGRRSTLIPLVLESFDWVHGVLLGASQSSEKTAAAVGVVGEVRHDPFAMLPFCGYNMGDYFQHWLDQEKDGRKMPKIFSVNWFRKDDNGSFIWPGFKENVRVLKWIFERIDETVSANKTPIGYLPKELDRVGLNISDDKLNQLFDIDIDGFLKNIEDLYNYFNIFGDKFPKVLHQKLNIIYFNLKNNNLFS